MEGGRKGGKRNKRSWKSEQRDRSHHLVSVHIERGVEFVDHILHIRQALLSNPVDSPLRQE